MDMQSKRAEQGFNAIWLCIGSSAGSPFHPISTKYEAHKDFFSSQLNDYILIFIRTTHISMKMFDLS